MPESKDAGDLAELRKLLIGPAEVGSVLPEAVRAARQKLLRDALQPLFERAFQVSVRNNPQVLADAISPIIGPAVRRAIGIALRDFGENVNQVFEKTASFRALRWRMESRVTGRPFSDIVLSKSLLYTVEQVFLIHRGTGLLLAQAATENSVLKNADMVSAMLLPLQDYVSDSFKDENQQLETLEVGRHKLWIQYGPKALLVGAVSGSAPVALRNVFRNALDEIHAHLYAPLDTFQGGDVTPFEVAKPYLDRCLLGHSAAQKQRRRWLPRVLAAAIVSLFLVWLAFFIRDQRRWNAYVRGLEGRPGLVIIEARRSRHEAVIRGLKDPDAPVPAPPAGERVRFDLQSYLSQETEWSRARDFQAARQRVERGAIRFEAGSAGLDPSQASTVDDLSSAIRQLLLQHPDARVTVTGHTDEVGTEETNLTLSQRRARQVIDALAERGVPRGRLEARGVGNSQPIPASRSDGDRSFNRRVSFAVN